LEDAAVDPGVLDALEPLDELGVPDDAGGAWVRDPPPEDEEL
jgi:hypothetical protein